ncbi:MAG TPA: ubiquitin-like small modifier protein 1 [Anaerolineales bacterium]|jgi:MoaD family protein
MPTVKLFANLRKIAGIKETSVAGTSAGAVLAQLVREYPALAGHLLEDGRLRPHVILTINGNPSVELGTAVTEQDQIGIFPPITGGEDTKEIT